MYTGREIPERYGTFPARGTWIEIRMAGTKIVRFHETFPARGTWIEIRRPGASCGRASDVPRKGNVDRNCYIDVERW